MAIPLLQIYRVAKYLAGRKLRGDKRYPLVLMLEPLFQCNLACAGCGKIDYPKEILQKRVSVEDALRAVDECGAPMVSIPGGEPLIHKEMPQIVAGIVARKKFVYLCTNAILLAKHIDEYQPSPYLTFSIHLDGNRERHDESVCQEGVFDKAVAADHSSRAARAFASPSIARCSTARIRMTSPISSIPPWASASRESRSRRATAITMRRARTCSWAARASKQLFREIFKRRRRALRQVLVVQSFRPVPRTFSRATRAISARPGAIRPTTCSAGSGRAICCPTRAMRRPTARSSRTPSGTSYGVGRNPRCDNCMAHCGFEGTAVNDAFSHPLKALMTALSGPADSGPMAPELPFEYAEGTGAIRRGRGTDARDRRHQAREPRVAKTPRESRRRAERARDGGERG